MKIVVYTAIMVKNPEEDAPIDLPSNFDLIPGWDYVLITNVKNAKNIFKNSGWNKGEIRIMNPPEDQMPSKTRRGWQIYAARWFKWHPDSLFADYDFVIWVDGWQVPNFNKKDSWYSLIHNINMKHINNDTDKCYICHDVHDKNTCMYEEHKAIVFCQKDTDANMLKVTKYLKAMKCPPNLGLFWTGCYVYKVGSDEFKKVIDDLWTDMLLYTYRDQALLIFEIWRNKASHVWGKAKLRELVLAVDTDRNHGGYL